MIGGVYHPRARGGAMSDALADAKLAMNRLVRMLGNRTGFRKPAGGFFLWLATGNGEETTLRLWQEQGVKVLPGATMGREIHPGKTQSNPGFSYVRVALVSDLSTIMTALERVKDFLG